MASVALEALEARLRSDAWSAGQGLRRGEPEGALELILPSHSIRAAVRATPRACCLLCLQQPKTPAAMAVLPALCGSGAIARCGEVVRAVGQGLTPSAHRVERFGLVLLIRFCAKQIREARGRGQRAAGAGWPTHSPNGGGEEESDCDGCAAMIEIISATLSQHLSLDAKLCGPTLSTLRDGLSLRNAPRIASAASAGATGSCAPHGGTRPGSGGAASVSATVPFANVHRWGLVPLSPLARLVILTAAKRHLRNVLKADAHDEMVERNVAALAALRGGDGLYECGMSAQKVSQRARAFADIALASRNHDDALAPSPKRARCDATTVGLRIGCQEAARGCARMLGVEGIGESCAVEASAPFEMRRIADMEDEEALVDCLRMLSEADRAAPEFSPLAPRFLGTLVPRGLPGLMPAKGDATLRATMSSRLASPAKQTDAMELVHTNVEVGSASTWGIDRTFGSEGAEVGWTHDAGETTWDKCFEDVEGIVYRWLAPFIAPKEDRVEKSPKEARAELTPSAQVLASLTCHLRPVSVDGLLGAAGRRALRWSDEVCAAGGTDSAGVWASCILSCLSDGGQEDLIAICAVMVDRLLEGVSSSSFQAGKSASGPNLCASSDHTTAPADWAAAMLAESLCRPASFQASNELMNIPTKEPMMPTAAARVDSPPKDDAELGALARDHAGDGRQLPLAAWVATTETLLAAGCRLGYREEQCFSRHEASKAVGNGAEDVGMEGHPTSESEPALPSGGSEDSDRLVETLRRVSTRVERLLLLPFESCAEALGEQAEWALRYGTRMVRLPTTAKTSEDGLLCMRLEDFVRPAETCSCCSSCCREWRRTLRRVWPLVRIALGGVRTHVQLLDSLLRAAARLVRLSCPPRKGSTACCRASCVDANCWLPESPPKLAFDRICACTHAAWAFLRIPSTLAISCCRSSPLYLPAVLPLMTRSDAQALLHATALSCAPIAPPLAAATQSDEAAPRQRESAAAVCDSCGNKSGASKETPVHHGDRAQGIPAGGAVPRTALLLTTPPTPLRLCTYALLPLVYGAHSMIASCGAVAGEGHCLNASEAHSRCENRSDVSHVSQDHVLLAVHRGVTADMILASHSVDTLASIFLPRRASQALRARRAELLRDLLAEWVGELADRQGRINEGQHTPGRVLDGTSWSRLGVYETLVPVGTQQGLRFGPIAHAAEDSVHALRRFFSVFAQARIGLELDPSLTAALVRHSGALREALLRL